MPERTFETVTWDDFETECACLAGRHRGGPAKQIFGIPSGGAPVAVRVSNLLGLELLDLPGLDSTDEGKAVLIVDDLVDSGRTASAATALYPKATFDALYRKPHSPVNLALSARTRKGWLRFPWERDGGDPTDAVIRLLEFIGEDPMRDGLIDTPRRVTRAWYEMTRGGELDPAQILSTTFDIGCDEMVVIRAVPFTSLCEHHVLPFTGSVTMGYIPAKGQVVGLSKLARLIDAFARRLQVQERMTMQLAQALEDHLTPAGVGVVIRATHSCMACRGVSKPAEMVTSALRGIMLHSAQSRAEFMALAQL